MDRFDDCDDVIYDANILVYYCFLYKDVRILELTKKVRNLTQRLINKKTLIIVPDFVVNELKRKGIAEIVDEYLKKPHKLVGLPTGRIRKSYHLKLMNVIEKKFLDTLEKKWLSIQEYQPEYGELKSIRRFFLSKKDDPKMIKLLDKKGRSPDKLCPSDEDLSLILFSKEIESSVISNDYDITCFSDELTDIKLCFDIVSLSEISIRTY